MNDHTIETIGCDLGDKLSAVFLIGPDGKTEQARVRTTRAAMEDRLWVMGEVYQPLGYRGDRKTA